MQGMWIQMAKVHLQPRHLHFGRCSPLSSPPCLQSRALVIQPTPLPPVTILRCYPWPHIGHTLQQTSKNYLHTCHSTPCKHVVSQTYWSFFYRTFIFPNTDFSYNIVTSDSNLETRSKLSKRSHCLESYNPKNPHNKKEYTHPKTQRAACFPTAFSA